MMIDTASAAEWSQVDVGAAVVVASLVFIVARLVIFPAWSLVKLRRARARHSDGAVDAAFRPGAMVYTDGARFRVRDRDDCGDSIPDFARGRTGTVVTVEGPVSLGGVSHRPVVEMIYTVQYDDAPGVYARLSHLWMEPLPRPVHNALQASRPR
ncbi:Uncharacterised protein [Mycobacteroides abscessus subsp. abscessus]|nr:Uncharacterised protein [Mycobacteroides abscessus subsp. abscessus]